MCHNHEEDQDHLFLHCQYDVQVQTCSNEPYFCNVANNPKVNEWLSTLPHDGKIEVSCLRKALSICLQIWNDRNASILKNENPKPYQSVIRTLTMAKEYFKENTSHEKNLEAGCQDNLIKWQPLHLIMLK